MNHRGLAAAFAVIAVVALLPMLAAAQPVGTTSWGDPDLQGVWDYRTLTPLERPEALGDKAFLTEEEAASLERETLERNERLLNRAPERTPVADQVDRREDGTVGAYNNFWTAGSPTARNARATSPMLLRRGSRSGETGEGRSDRRSAGWRARSPGRDMGSSRRDRAW